MVRTGEVVGIGSKKGVKTSGTVQLDAIRLKDGCQIKVGDVLTPDMIERAYDIKGGRSVKVRSVFKHILNSAEDGVNDVIKVRPPIQWVQGKKKWQRTPGFLVGTRLLKWAERLEKISLGAGPLIYLMVAQDKFHAVGRQNDVPPKSE